MWTTGITLGGNYKIKYFIKDGKKRISISTQQKDQAQETQQKQVYTFKGSY
tara:strand:- start:15717 stop:15869 length:153 start_codon:yes stop_codon:yes gene_type:complete